MQCEWWTGTHTTTHQTNKNEFREIRSVAIYTVYIYLYIQWALSISISLFLSHATALNREDNVSSFAFHHSKYCLLLCLLTHDLYYVANNIWLFIFLNTCNTKMKYVDWFKSNFQGTKNRESFNFLVNLQWRKKNDSVHFKVVNVDRVNAYQCSFW